MRPQKECLGDAAAALHRHRGGRGGLTAQVQCLMAVYSTVGEGIHLACEWGLSGARRQQRTKRGYELELVRGFATEQKAPRAAKQC